MKQHKWHKEIKAWADGEDVEVRWVLDNGTWSDWKLIYDPYFCWLDKNEYRIKPQELINGLTEEETNNTMSVKGLSPTRRDLSLATDPIPIVTNADLKLTYIKEPKYLYVYLDDNYELSTIQIDNDNWKYIGKIKLEVDDE